MRKKIALGVSLALMLTSLVSCGGGATDTGSDDASSSGQEIALRVAWWGNQVRNDRTHAVIEMYANENSDITFSEEMNEFSAYNDRLAVQAAGNSLPDILQMDYAYIDQYAKSNQLLDLSPYIDSGELDVSNVSQTILSSGTIDDKVYGIPLGINAPVLFYNQNVVADAGVTIPENMTWEQFIDISKTIYDKTGVKTNLSYGNGIVLFQYVLRGNGERLYADDGKIGASLDSATSAYQLYVDAVDEGWHTDPAMFVEISPTSVEENPLQSGNSWCAFVWSNQATAYNNSKPDGVTYGFTEYPSNDTQKSNYLKPSQFFCISANSKNPDEAVAFLNYFINSVEANEILLVDRGVPVSSVVAQAISPSLNPEDQAMIEYIDVVTENSSEIDPPDPDGSSEVKELFDNLAEEVCYKQITPEEAGTRFIEEGNKALGN